MKLSESVVNVQAIEDGAWVDNIPELPGVRIKTRGSNNKAWRRKSASLFDTIPRNKKVGNRVDPDELDRIMTTLLVECGIIDWEGIENDDGSPVPFSRDVAKKLLADPQYVKLKDGVLWAATMVAEQRAGDIEDTIKN
jgi:hypothetical protein